MASRPGLVHEGLEGGIKDREAAAELVISRLLLTSVKAGWLAWWKQKAKQNVCERRTQ